MATQHQSGRTEAQETRDHDTIRRWAEQRGAVPTTVRGTERGGEEAGILRFDFVGDGQKREESLEEISWEEFFDKFDEANLTFLYQDRTADGHVSRFFKFVRH
ncbi:hypothetical protein [Inquilinus limosus]|uniref:hypothetical protein n=1 Tax=Inquilinus limosus TaxID=171674 RepID=UPI0003FAF6A3|nr:hypothetical protein [Inquilinus limosus]